jgi:oligopeptide transport system substrate-binding protein
VGVQWPARPVPTAPPKIVMRHPFKTLLCALALASPAVEAASPTAVPKVVTIARVAQFDSLDPVRQHDDDSRQLVALLFDSLLQYRYLSATPQLEPDLLARMPELGADKLTYTFTLRKGVRFHDDACFPGGQGRELDVDDVLFSMKRFGDARLNTKSWFAIEGAVVGYDAFHAATAAPGAPADTGKLEITGFHKIDATHFTLRLTHPNPLFLTALSYASAGIVPPEALKMYGDQFANHPVGTGPYILKEVDRKGVLRFEKYARYHGTYPSTGAPGDGERGLLRDAGRPLPLIDVLLMPLIEEAQPLSLQFQRGQVDVLRLDRASFNRMVGRNADGTFKVADAMAARFDVFSYPEQAMFYYGFNMRDALVGRNKLLRQAFARLVDTRGEINTLLNGRGVKLQSMVSVSVPGNEHDTGASFPDFDLATAKKLLAQAGYPDGKGLPPITVTYPRARLEDRNAFDYLKARFARAGVQLAPEFLDNADFIKRTDAGNFQMMFYGWSGDPDAADFYQLLLSRNIGAGSNLTAFSNAAYDREFDAAQLLPNGPERFAHFRKMNAILADEIPMIFTYDPVYVGLKQKWLLNYKPSSLSSELIYVDVDMALKARRP